MMRSPLRELYAADVERIKRDLSRAALWDCLIGAVCVAVLAGLVIAMAAGFL